MKKRKLRLKQIRLDGGTQPRVELDTAVVYDYADCYEANTKMPPLVVFFDGVDYWLADGFHRRFGADKAGLKSLECDVREGTRDDARWFSYSVNQTHGLRRKNTDKARAVIAALKHPKGAKMSDTAIAKHVGVDHKTVANRRAELESTREIPKSDARAGRDGRVIDTKNIGPKRPPTVAELNEGVPDEVEAVEADVQADGPPPAAEDIEPLEEPEPEDEPPAKPGTPAEIARAENWLVTEIAASVWVCQRDMPGGGQVDVARVLRDMADEEAK